MVLWQVMISSVSRTRYLAAKLKQGQLCKAPLALVSRNQNITHICGMTYFCDVDHIHEKSSTRQKGSSVLRPPHQHDHIRARNGFATILCTRLRHNGAHMFCGVHQTSLISKCQLSDNSREQRPQDILLKDDPELKSLLSELADDFAADLESRELDTSDSDSTSSVSDSSGSEDEMTESNIPIDRDNSDNSCDKTSEIVKEMIENVEYEDFYDFDNNVEEIEEDYDPALDSPIPLERGVSGVFDLDELVTLLHSENAMDICVIEVPHHLAYVDYLVIVTGRSTRHLTAIAQYVKYLYKKKRGNHDPKSVKIEGENTSLNWLAMDLGNIALHLFLEHTRSYYDLESLWTLGEEFDLHSKTPEKDTFVTHLNELDFLGVLDEPHKTDIVSPVIGEQKQKFMRSKKVGDMRDFRPVFHGLESVSGWNQGPKDNSGNKK